MTSDLLFPCCRQVNDDKGQRAVARVNLLGGGCHPLALNRPPEAQAVPSDLTKTTGFAAILSKGLVRVLCPTISEKRSLNSSALLPFRSTALTPRALRIRVSFVSILLHCSHHHRHQATFKNATLSGWGVTQIMTRRSVMASSQRVSDFYHSLRSVAHRRTLKNKPTLPEVPPHL